MQKKSFNNIRPWSSMPKINFFLGWQPEDMGNMLIVTPGKVTLANYHPAIKHPVKNHLLKVTPLKKSPAIMNIFIKNGWMLLHQMAYNGPDHVQITKVSWRLTVSWKKFFNKSSKMFYSKVNWKHFCWILYPIHFFIQKTLVICTW